MSLPSSYDFDWSELAFTSKKPIKELNAVFITAPRELSVARFKQIIKDYLPKNNLLLGLAKERYIDGFGGQPQFKTLRIDSLKQVIEQVNKSSNTHKIYTISYFQREEKYLIEKIDFSKILLVNGSWKYALQNRQIFYQIANKNIPYARISPFTGVDEAKNYEKLADEVILKTYPITKGQYSSEEMLGLAAKVAKYSYDYNFQTGAVLGRSLKGKSDSYELIDYSFNKVTPFQTYAMLYGASREDNFSPPHDLNFYDTVHAEVMMMLKSTVSKVNLKGTALFINLMPCPTCARMFCETEIDEFVYQYDHSEGYALKILQTAGKTLRRLVPSELPKI